MIARYHYDDATLNRLLDRHVEPDSEVARHVEFCDACQTRLEMLSKAGMTWREVGQLLLPDDVPGHLEPCGLFDGEPERLRSSVKGFLESSDHPDSLGRFARYEIMELLGRGGMGVVMRGYDPQLNRNSAIKVLAPELASSAAARKRFSREAKSAAAVVHPHVVPIQTVDEHNGLPYLVMPVVEGQSLQHRVEQEGPLRIIEAVRIAAQVAEGLSAAHEQGLVHRDIKPANVLLDNGVERVQITDFGLARAIDDASMTRSGVIAGTPQYMSPEQAHGDAIDLRSDLFSLGSLIYFMLAGRSPFRAETTMGVLNRIGNDQPRSIRSVNADVPEWLEQIVLKLLSKAPINRYQTAGEVALLLQGWHAHLQQPDTVKPPLPLAEPLAANRDATLTGEAKNHRRLVGWIVSLVSIAALAVAGILIVLELNKGTLTIESDADNVPIKIVQGDNVIEQLTVSQSGKSTRIAAGNYEVEIGDGFDGVVAGGGFVSLKRGASETVRITLEEADQSRVVGDEVGDEVDEFVDTELPTYSGKNIREWFATHRKVTNDPRFQNYGPRRPENIFRAIEVLRDHGDNDTLFIAELKTRFDFVKHELNPEALDRAAETIVVLAGQRHQDVAIKYLFQLADLRPMPTDAAELEWLGDTGKRGQPFPFRKAIAEITRWDQALAQQLSTQMNTSSRRILGCWIVLPSEFTGTESTGLDEDITKQRNRWWRNNAATMLAAAGEGLEDSNSATRYYSVMLAMVARTAMEPIGTSGQTSQLTALPIDESLKKRIGKLLQSETDPYVVSFAAKLLASIDSENQNLRDKQLDWARSMDSDKAWVAMDLMADRPTESVGVLIELLKDQSWSCSTTEAFHGLGQEFPNGRNFAIAILGHAGKDAQPALETLNNELKSEFPECRDQARLAIQAIQSAMGNDESGDDGPQTSSLNWDWENDIDLSPAVLHAEVVQLTEQILRQDH